MQFFVGKHYGEIVHSTFLIGVLTLVFCTISNDFVKLYDSKGDWVYISSCWEHVELESIASEKASPIKHLISSHRWPWSFAPEVRWIQTWNVFKVDSNWTPRKLMGAVRGWEVIFWPDGSCMILLEGSGVGSCCSCALYWVHCQGVIPGT